MRHKLGALLLVLSAATVTACEDEPFVDGSTEWLLSQKGIHIDHIPANDTFREGVVLIAFATDIEYGDRVILRNSLAPGEVLQLNLHNTTTGEFIWDGVEFQLSDETVVQHLGGGAILGVSDGEAIACGRHWGQESCIPLVVGGGMLEQYFSSDTGASSSITLMSLDGVPAMNGNVPLLQVSGSYESQYTAMSPDGRFMADLVNLKLRSFSPSWEMDLPVPPEQGWEGWYTYNLYSNGGKATIVAWGMTKVYVAQVLSDGTKVCPMKPLAEVGDGGSVSLLSISPDGNQVLARVQQDGSAAPDVWLIELCGMKGKPFPTDVSWAETLSFSQDGTHIVAIGGSGTSEPGQDRAISIFSDQGGAWKETHQAVAPAAGQPDFSPDGTFALFDDGMTAAVLVLETGESVELPAGGRLTPWNTVHFWTPAATSVPLSGARTSGGEAYEYLPLLETAVPTRIYLPLGEPAPSGRAFSFASLFAPVAAVTPDEETFVGFRWVSVRPLSLDPPEQLEPADDPGAFLAVLAPLPNVPSNSLMAPHSGVELLDLGGDGSRWLSAGNEDVVSLDVSHNGLVFMVTYPFGYLVVSDTGMRRYSVLAIGVSGPVTASADGKRVAVWAPAGTVRVYDVNTGEELLSHPGATTVCLPPNSSDIYLADVNGQGLRRLADGTSQILYGGVDSPRPDHGVHYSWSDDCRRMAVSGGDWISLFEEGHDGQSTVDAQGADLATLSRDGKAMAFVGAHQETVDEYDGQLIEKVGMIDLYLARAPGWKPKRLVTWAAYAGGYSSGITYSFERPAVWPGGDMVAVPFSETAVSTSYGEYGVSQSVIRNSRLLFVDSDGGITNMGPMSADPKYLVEGTDVLRIR